MANLSNINNKFLVTTTGEVLIGQTANNGNRLQITGADGASYIYLKTDVATTGGRIGFNGDALRVFNQQTAGELQLGTAGTSRVRISNSLVVFPTITELRGDISTKFAIGNMGGASSQMMVSSRGFLTFNVSNTGSALDATERMRIDSSGNISVGIDTPLYLYSEQDIGQIAVNRVPSNGFITDTSRSAAYINLNASNGGSSLSFHTANANNTAPTERMKINSSGDVGIGTTPETAGPTWRTLFIGASAAIVSRQSAAGSDSIFANNYYVNSSNQDRVRVNAPSSRMFLDANNIRFQISPSSSSAPSWSEIMRIDDSGNVGIGTTSPTLSKLVISGGTTGSVGGGDAGITMINKFDNPDNSWSILPVITGVSNTGFSIRDNTDSADRLVIDGSGNVGLGTTNIRAKLSFPNIVDTNGYDVTSIRLWDNASTIFYGLGVSGSQFNLRAGSSDDGYAFWAGETHRMQIQGVTGNVGIGTTSPVNKIQANYAPVAIASLTASSGTSSTNWNRNAFLMGTGASVSNALAFGVSGTANDRKAWIQSGHPDSAANSLGTISLNPLGGNVGIGLTSPTYKLHVASSNNVSIFEDTSDASGAAFIVFNRPGVFSMGSITRNGSANSVSYNTGSDYRLKEDLKDFNALDLVNNITAYDYKWKDVNQRDYGFIAHELKQTLPNVVTGEKDGEKMQGVDYSKLTPILLKAIQELKAEIDVLKSK